MRTRIRSWRRKLSAAIPLLALMAAPPGLAADPPPSGQASVAASPSAQAPGVPARIGLALSGGGARGIAHVGVLKVLEEMRIPIHCVTGTSMGAIVGGTFAAGVTPEKIEEVVLKTNWDEVFRDQPPREEIAIRRKIYDYKTLFRPEFGVKDGTLAVPTGVLAGVSIEAFFRVLTAQAYDISDFRKLPIPFRAMATDIETGDSVVLDQGSIAQAMRASMSVPGALAPVEIDGKLLVDGGIANNLPINEARKLCADVVIAVNISTPPLKRSEITSALSVASQLVNLLGKHTVDEQLKTLTSRDVLIAPELGDISAAKFDRSADAIRIGEAATQKLAPLLQRYSVSPEQYAALRKTQIAEVKSLGTVASVEFKGLERTNAAVLRELVDTKPGDPLDDAKIGLDLRRIYGRDDFEGIGYTIGGTAGPRPLIIEPREKSWGPDYLRFGLGLQSDFHGDNQFNVLFEYRKTWLNRLGGEWLTQFQIGQNTYIGTELYQPLEESGRWFVLPYAQAGRQTRGVFFGNDKVADYLLNTVQGGIDAGAVIGTSGQLKIGPVWTHVNAQVDTGSPVLPAVKELTAGLRAELFVDRLNHAWFPTDGVSGNAHAYAALPALGSAQSYEKLEGTARWVKSWGNNTVQLGVQGGTDFGTNMPAYESFTLGGPLHLSGYRINQFAGREFWFARAMYYNKIFPLPDLLGSGVYLGASAETGRMSHRFDGLPSPGQLWSGSTFIGADTFLGPAFVGVGVAPAGRWSLYMLLGAP